MAVLGEFWSKIDNFKDLIKPLNFALLKLAVPTEKDRRFRLGFHLSYLIYSIFEFSYPSI